jgi:hypothetical protein
MLRDFIGAALLFIIIITVMYIAFGMGVGGYVTTY